MDFEVRVKPKSGRNRIEMDGDRITVRVTAPPEDGRANDAVVKLLAKGLGVARSRVRIVKGRRGRDKRLVVEEMTAGEVVARLSQPG